MTDPSLDDSPGSRRWFHQAIAGAALRAGLAVTGLLPAALFLVAEVGPRLPLLQAFVGVFAYAAALFALERRDAPWPQVAARLAAGGLLGAPLGWLAGASLEFVGEPWRAWEQLTESLRDTRLVELLAMGMSVLLVTQVLGAWFHVRARTERALPQVVCGLVLTGLPVLFFLAVEHRVGGEEALGCLVALASGALVPLLVALGERRLVHARVDPQAPRAASGEARPAVAGGGLVILGLLGTFGAFVPDFDGYYPRRGESMSIGALKTITTSQTLFREGSKGGARRDGTDPVDYAASTHELSSATLIDSVLGGGVKQGYVFRVLHSATTPEFLWIAAADPLGPPGARGDRCFVTNHAGVIYYRMIDQGGPAVLDAETCEVPAGWLPVGK